MTPKEKAEELFKIFSKGKDKHGWNLCEFDSCAKECALIAINEIIKFGNEQGIREPMMYYYKVKEEIEKL
jgi:hypothetical protein